VIILVWATTIRAIRESLGPQEDHQTLDYAPQNTNKKLAYKKEIEKKFEKYINFYLKCFTNSNGPIEG